MLNQSLFARMCKIPMRTLVYIEHGEGNQTLKLLNAAYSPPVADSSVTDLSRSKAK
ncbi:MAG: DNA-binding protein [Pseudomonas sp.]|jgi:hypothetical protein|nr:DNA-binding protein [Pseudomonas sp.]